MEPYPWKMPGRQWHVTEGADKSNSPFETCIKVVRSYEVLSFFKQSEMFGIRTFRVVTYRTSNLASSSTSWAPIMWPWGWAISYLVLLAGDLCWMSVPHCHLFTICHLIHWFKPGGKPNHFTENVVNQSTVMVEMIFTMSCPPKRHKNAPHVD